LTPDTPAAEQTDPLAELARLVGQDDPFARAGRGLSHTAPLHDTIARRVEAPSLVSGALRRAEEAGLDRRGQRGEPDDDVYAPDNFATWGVRQHDRGEVEFDGGSYGSAAYDREPPSAGSDPYYGDEDELPEEEAWSEPEPPKERRGGLLTVMAVIALAVFGTIGAFAYRSFIASPSPGVPPTIKAETTPSKVPAAPQAVGAQQQSYDRASDVGQRETVLPREEQPVDLREPARLGAPTMVGSIAVPGRSEAAPPPPPPAVAGQEPKRVKTVVIRPEQPTGTVGPSRPPSRAATAAPSAAETGSYLVQLSSQKTEADAQASYRVLQSKYPALLGNRQAIIRRVDLGEKGVFYRAQVGPFASAEEATDFCGSLKAAGGQCLVQRN
jgi:cell division septation protein DedD